MNIMLNGKTVVLGVTGSIAAYKMANVASALVKEGADVRVVMTKNATNFINPITFETLTNNKCLVDTFDRNFQFHVAHVSLSQKADVFMIAPASDVGAGKLPGENILLDYIRREIEFTKDMAGLKVLVTAGPTVEKIDPVRYITNHSSGKMGYAVAEIASKRGADVTLISGSVHIEPPAFVKIVNIQSADDMYNAVMDNLSDCDILVKAAAVADYTVPNASDEKIKKKDDDLSLALSKTKDILKAVGERKTDRQIICGFSMETSNLIENSKKKLDNTPFLC